MREIKEGRKKGREKGREWGERRERGEREINGNEKETKIVALKDWERRVRKE